MPTEAETYETLNALLHSSEDRYVCMNRVRDWFNAHFPDFDLYLEDVWNENVEGETHFEYILRSKETYNETERLAFDVYKNHRTEKGVWHLGDYQRTEILIDNPRPIIDFLNANGVAWSG